MGGLAADFSATSQPQLQQGEVVAKENLQYPNRKFQGGRVVGCSIDEIAAAPARLRASGSGLAPEQLDTPRAYCERCRSAFRGDGDRDSARMPITIPRGSRSPFRREADQFSAVLGMGKRRT
jgi:hypothetical protein